MTHDSPHFEAKRLTSGSFAPSNAAKHQEQCGQVIPSHSQTGQREIYERASRYSGQRRRLLRNQTIRKSSVYRWCGLTSLMAILSKLSITLGLWLGFSAMDNPISSMVEDNFITTTRSLHKEIDAHVKRCAYTNMYTADDMYTVSLRVKLYACMNVCLNYSWNNFYFPWVHLNKVPTITGTAACYKSYILGGCQEFCSLFSMWDPSVRCFFFWCKLCLDSGQTPSPTKRNTSTSHGS